LEDSEEGRDRLRPAGALAEVLQHVEGVARIEEREETVELAAHRVALERELERWRVLAVVADEDALERPQEVEERHLAQVDLGGLRLRLGGLPRARRGG